MFQIVSYYIIIISSSSSNKGAIPWKDNMLMYNTIIIVVTRQMLKHVGASLKYWYDIFEDWEWRNVV